MANKVDEVTTAPQVTPEVALSMKMTTPEKLAAEKAIMGAKAEVSEVVAPVPTPAASMGGEIAAAIAQGLKDSKRDKTIKITSDKSVVSRFSVVRSKLTGEVMLRENESGVLSKIQLQSIEEKEASIQGQEVEEIRVKK